MLRNLFIKPDFDGLLQDYKNNPEALLIDVREIDEYKQGHVPDSINVPLSQIEKINDIVKEKDKPLYIYCLAGSRSMQAHNYLKSNGYTNVINLGGINNYHGEREK